jgi:hypothetical protein
MVLPLEAEMRALIGLMAAGCMDYGTGQNVGRGVPPGPDEVPEGWNLEEFEGSAGTTADVVVFGDTSGSMDEELRTLGQTITAFVQRLATHVDGWQLAAVTGGDGCSPSGVLTPSTDDYAERFADAITTEVGDDDEAEMGLHNVLQVLQNSGPGECNEGLVRGGLLHIVFVSDENEESPGYDESPAYWGEWVQRIGEAHGDPSQVIMSAVAGPTPTGCFGADPGFGYDAVVEATGGEFLSICDDWASEIDLLADATSTRDRFPLADIPVSETLQVWVNELELLRDAGYTYDQPANMVTLADPTGPGDTVAIYYQIAD